MLKVLNSKYINYDYFVDRGGVIPTNFCLSSRSFTKITARPQSSNVQHHVFSARHYRRRAVARLESVHFARQDKKTKRPKLRSHAIITKYGSFHYLLFVVL